MVHAVDLHRDIERHVRELAGRIVIRYVSSPGNHAAGHRLATNTLTAMAASDTVDGAGIEKLNEAAPLAADSVMAMHDRSIERGRA